MARQVQQRESYDGDMQKLNRIRTAVRADTRQSAEWREATDEAIKAVLKLLLEART